MSVPKELKNLYTFTNKLHKHSKQVTETKEHSCKSSNLKKDIYPVRRKIETDEKFKNNFRHIKLTHYNIESFSLTEG